ncbi:related to BNR/Asp-box repeat domain protein [Rhynchosporium agropyri]|uniref:Related to BNR/Asp-box repeat domain protein n=1 Tax=Rhynchosporium agropyri TaxID=914238 RepID=A0A1E1LT11_9HELO|nr:related to BNR/Asp-box repeat domain protein [Rhynchosporium agropyri]
MLLLSLALLLFTSYQAVAAAEDTVALPPQPFGHFTNNTIHQPIGNETFAYPRYLELTDGTVLATASRYWGTGQPHFLIFETTDGGANWKHLSNLTDRVLGSDRIVQPALAQLTEDIGEFKAGTIVATGNSEIIGTAGATQFDLYASTDRGRSWEFVSHIATGGAPNTTNGHTPIWEPYLLPYKGQLVVYYSDQGDPLHGQKLAHRTSSNLIDWDPAVNDVMYELYTARPGMTIVAYIPPTDEWILVYEYPVGNSSGFGVDYPVYYVIAKSPLEFGKSVGRPIIVNGNSTRSPNAGPYVVWSPLGGPNGTIIVSDSSNPQVFTNSFGGAINSWEEHATPASSCYSRSIQLLKTHPDNLLIYGGETWAGVPSRGKTPFTVTAVSLLETLKKPAEEQTV